MISTALGKLQTVKQKLSGFLTIDEMWFRNRYLNFCKIMPFIIKQCNAKLDATGLL